MIKQYTVEDIDIYTDRVSRYVDGKRECYEIISHREIKNYCFVLESMGYIKAYDLVKAEEELNKAKERYDCALACYKRAKKNALILKD